MKHGDEFLHCNKCPFAGITSDYVTIEIKCELDLRENADRDDCYYSCGKTLNELNDEYGTDKEWWDYDDLSEKFENFDYE